MLISLLGYSQTEEEYFNSAAAKGQAGDYRGAIEDYTKVIAINPRSYQSYCSRANAKLRLEDYRGAIIDCNMGIAIDELNADMSYGLRGVAKDRLGDNRGAIEDYNKKTDLIMHLE